MTTLYPTVGGTVVMGRVDSGLGVGWTVAMGGVDNGSVVALTVDLRGLNSDLCVNGKVAV